MGRCSSLANSLSCLSSASERLIVVLLAIKITLLYVQLHISTLLFFHFFSHLIIFMQKDIKFIINTYYNITMHNFKYTYVIYSPVIAEEM
jgi:hypothetical protein